MEETGTLTRDVADRAARPWLYRAELLTYGDEAWSTEHPDGTVERNFRVFSRPNLEPWTPPTTSGAPEIGQSLLDRLEAAAPEETVRIIVDLRNYPLWDIPLRSTTAPSSREDDEAAAEDRTAAIDARKAIYAEMASSAAEHIAQLGGRVSGNGWGGGWIVADLPARAVPALAERTDLRTMNLDEGDPTPFGWHMSEAKEAERTGAQAFIDNGFHGNVHNSARHSYGTIAIGIIECEGFPEDEACFLDDDAGCNSRSQLAEHFDCGDIDNDGNFCEPVTDFVDMEGPMAGHGTMVMSVAIAKYTQGQVGTHTSSVAGTSPNPDWEVEATGFAPEARVVYFGNVTTTDNHESDLRLADAFDDSIDRGLDITNCSWGYDLNLTPDCDAQAIYAFERESENAFDDGIFNVAATGNESAYESTCGLVAPGDLHTTFTVGGHRAPEAGWPHTAANACYYDHHDCQLGVSTSTGAST